MIDFSQPHGLYSPQPIPLFVPLRAGTVAVSTGIRGDQVFGGREDPASMDSDMRMKRLDQSLKQQQNINCLLRNTRRHGTRSLGRF